MQSTDQEFPREQASHGAGHLTAGGAATRARITRIARFLGVIYLGTVAVLYSLQTRLIFPGADTQGQTFAEVRPRPGTELVDLTTQRGVRVVALFGAALTPDGLPDPRAASRPTMIYFYGNAMCMNYAMPEFERFRRLGLNVLIPEYSGYGMSGGSPSETGCQDTALAAMDYLVSTRGVDPKRILAAGWSLGGAVAIDLAVAPGGWGRDRLFLIHKHGRPRPARAALGPGFAALAAPV